MSGVDAGLLALAVVLWCLAIGAWIMALSWTVRELARVIAAAIKPLRIRWRLVRDVDADLMRYRGWSTDELELEYFTLRTMRFLDPEQHQRLTEAVVTFGREIGIAADKAAEAFARLGVEMRSSRYPMDEPEIDGTP